ncbi:hypothetical protein ABFS82_02G109600 [Erythranthe guttata]
MASLVQLFSIILQFHFIIICCMSLKPTPRPYIVYMGSSLNISGGDDLSSHMQLLSSIIPSEESERRFLLNSYNHALKGFSAMLTENEAFALSGYDEVVSVFRDPILKLHTTRSWDFLEAADSEFRSNIFPHDQKTADVIIGIIDTGIWPESPSFDDRRIGKIPSKWKGVCMDGSDFNKSINCNRKLIGARFYPNLETQTNPTQAHGSPRDSVGHGTHTASIAGGSWVPRASYYGLARGAARGGLPAARIASYKACTEEGCAGSIILKAIDDAIRDGVDIISVSIGMSSIFESDFLSDPIAIGAFHAEQNGVTVVCSAGNDGPDSYTVVNSAPWIFTVAASTVDRDFRTRIILGNNDSYEGSAISFSPLKAGERYPLASGEKVASSFTPASDARNCIPGSLDSKKVAGKIIVCVNEDPNVSRTIKKLVVEDAKAKGVIIIDQELQNAPFDSGTYPYSQVGLTIGSKILHYINSTKNPSATIVGPIEIRHVEPAPVVASFSSRGPGGLTENILKPDIMAPGVAILAAFGQGIKLNNYDAPGNKSSAFSIRSGTSMACPHVSGAVAFVKSVHPNWSSSVIKSALMTTASITNNMRKNLTNTSDTSASPHEVGSGEIRPVKALDPGLAFETTTEGHLHFLCHNGYKQKAIRSISKDKNFTCPKVSSEELISSVNYPTISIARLSRREGPRKVKRVATNVGLSPNVTYVVSSVNAPPGLLVKVAPRTIVFTESVGTTASFKVFFDGKEASKGYNFGDVVWFDGGSHVVRLVFAVNVE